jgi:hypothetical protein
MFQIKDIKSKKFVTGITRYQGSPMVIIRGIEEAKQYHSYDEAKQEIKNKLTNCFEVVEV